RPAKMRLVVIQQREDDDAIFTPGVRLEVQRKKRVIQTFPGRHFDWILHCSWLASDVLIAS
ncbi:hypothetical protein, partial [Paraburkholderia caribensis]|uniref:hypothetical protein n=1 Tax=Paraburkholderia caribensis TaxID=75105 RepID=UPI001CC3501D